MKREEAITICREFNAWRRGQGRYSDEGDKPSPEFPYAPKEIGEAIDTLCKSPWVSIKEGKPKDGQLILYSKKGGETGRRFYETIYYPEPRITDDMDYWMPIEEIKED